MVSFSCENCGDVLTKKKLDPHRGQCRGASFTCLDCMTHFPGTSYKAHTSCISEAQKYQGALYKEKPSRATRKTAAMAGTAPTATSSTYQAYVEDVPDADEGAVAVVDAPPHAPSPPPPPVPAPVNVFDFLVDEATPDASTVSLGGFREPMRMVEHAPPVFGSASASPDARDGGGGLMVPSLEEEDDATANGHSYRTPAPKPRRRSALLAPASEERRSTDRKRKRQAEQLDPPTAPDSADCDEEMVDPEDVSTARLLHTGLTGGLDRLLSRARLPDAGADSTPTAAPHPGRRLGADKGQGRGRLEAQPGALVRVRKVRRTSDESRPRKHHRSHRHRSDEHPDSDRHRRASLQLPEQQQQQQRRRRRRSRAIEFPDQTDTDNNDEGAAAEAGGQMVVYRSRAELFLSFVTKGPESGSGCSVNKALKRYHREREALGLGLARVDEEKELWRGLRLRRNDRGEVVVIF